MVAYIFLYAINKRDQKDVDKLLYIRQFVDHPRNSSLHFTGIVALSLKLHQNPLDFITISMGPRTLTMAPCTGLRTNRTITLHIPATGSQAQVPMTRTDETSRWSGQFTFGGIHFHIEAIPVHDEQGTMQADSPDHDYLLEAYGTLADRRPQTLPIAGQSHLVIMFPHAA
jgi:hypothetical protein